MRRLLLVVLGMIVVVVLWLGWTLWLGGYWRDLGPRFAGTCKPITGIPGPEDLTIHPRTGMAYVSSTDWRAVMGGGMGHGAIYALDLAQASPTPRNLTPDAGPDFQPHGISLFVGAEGQADLLFVINHAGGHHTIEEYEIAADRLVHRRTLDDPLLRSPNDLVAVGPDLLYVSNDHRWPHGFLRTVEEWLRLPVSDVVMWDGKGFRVAASGIRLANGMNRSADGSTIYVASPVGGEVRVYDRDAASGMLALRTQIPLGTAPDNIEVVPDGSLWIGAHPNLFRFLQHRGGDPRHSPSEVVHVVPLPAGGFRVEQVLIDPGDLHCGSTVASTRGNRLLVGGLFEPEVLDCRMTTR